MKIIPVRNQFNGTNFTGMITPSELPRGVGLAFDKTKLRGIAGLTANDIDHITVFRDHWLGQCRQVVLTDGTYIYYDDKTLSIVNPNEGKRSKLLSDKLTSWMFRKKDLGAYVGEADKVFAEATAKLESLLPN